MLDALSRRLFLTLSHSSLLKKAVSRYGMREDRGFARRFIGGETIDEAIRIVHELGQRGFTHTLNHLGEHVTSTRLAEAATTEYLATIEHVAAAGLACKISVKLSQVGLELDRTLCTENLRRILIGAQHHGGFVRIDMEGSAWIDDTLDVFETVWREGLRNVGVVLQSYLYRTEEDLRRVMAAGARVRLCKGAYNEPSDVAYRDKADVDAAFVRLMQMLMANGNYPAFATHDPRMIAAVYRFAREQGVGTEAYEFQMLYGVRRDLQTSLRARGYLVRVYVPFGREWFPYFMRRLAERPANVGFVMRGLFYERMGDRSRFDD